MRLYNTASQQLEAKTWAHDVSLYVCGITPYDAAHMGHIFTFGVYDVLQRYLEFQGHSIKLVRNITDVDEPIYVRAAQLKIPYTQLASDETAHFQQIMQQLDMRPAFAEPKASDYIAHMATAVEELLASGHAYTLDGGDVYFDVASFPKFGDQSGLSQRLQLAFMTERGGDPERAGKRNPFDFLLWKVINDPADSAAWDSPVGHGRPGWHIECSVMSNELLGSPIDIHGGGMDLIFPHHEAETAQSESLGHTPFVKHWMHVAPLFYHGEKMSKSLGNLVFARDILKTHEPAVIRLALLSYHYRIGGEWHNDALETAKDQLEIIRTALNSAVGPDPTHCRQLFLEALDTDLDTPEALHLIMQLANETVRKGGDHPETATQLREMLSILGVNL